MAHYSAYFVNDDGLIVGVQSIKSATDEEAMREARRLIARAMVPNIEIWNVQQRIVIVYGA